MTTYQHPRGVQLINCDCEYCRTAERPVLLVVAPPGAERTPRYGWAVPNRLYGAEINHEGDAV